MAPMYITLIDACDRCGKVMAKLHPFKLSEAIAYRGKEIRFPWLCLACMKVEKKKWWDRKKEGT